MISGHSLLLSPSPSGRDRWPRSLALRRAWRRISSEASSFPRTKILCARFPAASRRGRTWRTRRASSNLVYFLRPQALTRFLKASRLVRVSKGVTRFGSGAARCLRDDKRVFVFQHLSDLLGHLARVERLDLLAMSFPLCFCLGFFPRAGFRGGTMLGRRGRGILHRFDVGKIPFYMRLG